MAWPTYDRNWRDPAWKKTPYFQYEGYEPMQPRVPDWEKQQEPAENDQGDQPPTGQPGRRGWYPGMPRNQWPSGGPTGSDGGNALPPGWAGNWLRQQNSSASGGSQSTGVPSGPPSYGGGGSMPRPQAPQTGGGGPPAYQAPAGGDYGRAESALDALGQQTEIARQRRERLGGPGEENIWEQLALGRFQQGDGFDPGTGQFEGSELPTEVWNEAQINQMAQQRAAPTIRALKDAERLFGQQASMGGSFSAANLASLKARQMLGGAGAINAATRDAQLEGARLNAEQAQRAAEQQRKNFMADLEARLGLGRLGLDTAGTLGGFGLQRRGLDQARDIERYRGGISQRGQDVESSMLEARLNAARDEARARGELGLSDQQLAERMGMGRLGLEARGQDIGREMGMGRLGMQGYGIEAGLYQGEQERATRMEGLDRQLADRSLDRETRATLQRERDQLQRDMQEAALTQRESEFGRQFGQTGTQFEQGLGERQRQFDLSQGLSREMVGRQQGFAREQGWLGREQEQKFWNQQDQAAQDKFYHDLMGKFAPNIASGKMSQEDAERLIADIMQGGGGAPPPADPFGPWW